ncbi:MAG: hypothetical protein R2705_07795 [Ilumatobacteraceae bacterium]
MGTDEPFEVDYWARATQVPAAYMTAWERRRADGELLSTGSMEYVTERDWASDSTQAQIVAAKSDDVLVWHRSRSSRHMTAYGSVCFSMDAEGTARTVPDHAWEVVGS